MIMITEDEKPLLQDLAARLPYGVKINCNSAKPIYMLQCIFVDAEDGHVDIMNDFGLTYNLEEVKPYLRPMSSMAEKEELELSEIFFRRNTDYQGAIDVTDFFYSHHIDCRGLIEKGLALEAPEGMYKTE